MQSFFTSDFFSVNRQRLRAAVDDSTPIILTANGLLQKGADSNYAFSQDANFWYFTGINEPDVTLVIVGSEEFLVVPSRDASRAAFDGDVDDTAMTERSGIDQIYQTAEGWERIAKVLKRTKQVAIVPAPPSYIERYGLYVNPARARLEEQLKAQVHDLEFKDIATQVVHMRMIKQLPELRAIQAAINATLATIKQVTKPARLKTYSHEYQLEAALTQGFRSRGTSGHAFEPIVAGGNRACTLHYVANNHELKTGEMIVIDVGAEVEHYAADITRTVANGPVSPRAQEIFAAVADVQQYALSLLKPGVYLKEYEKQVCLYMGQALKRLGVIQKVDQASVRKYYPHATSHFLGLNVHDVGDYELPLAPGMVITVEPGIYIPEEGVGVRIEDDVMITARGVKVLSKG